MQRDPLVSSFEPLEAIGSDPLAALTRRPLAPGPANDGVAPASVEIATLHGFDLDERPLVRELQALPGELVVARSTVALRRESIGASLVVVFEHGDPRRPIVLGVLQPLASAPTVAPETANVRIDDATAERLVLRAEREIVLECGDASITLTRAGKVLIRGHYILSRASGYNRIKGAAVDIN